MSSRIHRRRTVAAAIAASLLAFAVQPLAAQTAEASTGAGGKVAVTYSLTAVDLAGNKTRIGGKYRIRR